MALSYLDPEQNQRLDGMYGDITGIDTSIDGITGNSVPTTGTQVAGPADSYGTNIMATESSGGDPNAKNPRSTARGRFQFLDSTYDEVIRNHPELRGKDRNDPAVLAAFSDDNARTLRQALGHSPSNTEVHAAHFLGPQGAVRFIKGLQENPNQPAVNLVDANAAKSNPETFYRKDGTPKTAAEIYASAEKQFGNKPYAGVGEMPDAGSFLASRFASREGQPRERSEGTQYAANDTGTMSDGTTGGSSGGSGHFKSAEEQFGEQRRRQEAYMAGQPEMWRKLEAMSNDYQNATKRSPWDMLETGLNQYQQSSSAARANQLATTGGILTKSLPSSREFVGTLENAAKTQRDQRLEEMARAKTAYDLGSGNLLAQNKQQGENVAAQGALTKDMAGYDTQTKIAEMEDANRRKTAELTERGQNLDHQDRSRTADVTERGQNLDAKAKEEKLKLEQEEMKLRYGDAQAKDLQANINTIPNPTTRALVQQAFLTSPDIKPGMSLDEKLKVLSDIKVKIGNDPNTPLEAEKNKMMLYTYYLQGKDELQKEEIDVGTKAGRDRAAALRNNPGVTALTPTDMAASQTTINTGAAGATGETGGAPGSYQAQKDLSQTANLARELLTHLKSGTGIINSETARPILSNWNQLSGRNDLEGNARDMFHVIMGQLTQKILSPQMAALKGSMSDKDLAYLQQAVAGKMENPLVLEKFLDGVAKRADWEQRRQSYMLETGQNFERKGIGFGPNRRTIEENKWLDANPLPAIDLAGLVDQLKEAEAKKSGGGPIPWFRSVVGGSSTPAPARPSTAPVTSSDENLLSGGGR